MKHIPVVYPALLLIMALMVSCHKKDKTPVVTNGSFSIRNFSPMTNWNPAQTLFLDYTDAISHGFVIPTIRQVEGGYFMMEFHIRNDEKEPRKFRYKIFYQNESYRFPERDLNDSTLQHPHAWENFYGSWENTAAGFAETPAIPADNEFHRITSAFRIVGNPRNETRYFSGQQNDRFKRNPRVGRYAFMLVVTDEKNLISNTIPDEVADIGLPAPGGFVNPWFYFLYGKGKDLPNTTVARFPDYLTVAARPDPGAGIYLHPIAFSAETAGKFGSGNCGQTDELFRTAAFEQFIHYVDASTKFSNIPVITDIQIGRASCRERV